MTPRESNKGGSYFGLVHRSGLVTGVRSGLGLGLGPVAQPRLGG